MTQSQHSVLISADSFITTISIAMSLSPQIPIQQILNILSFSLQRPSFDLVVKGLRTTTRPGSGLQFCNSIRGSIDAISSMIRCSPENCRIAGLALGQLTRCCNACGELSV